jgi:hypothetical protein
MMRTLLVLAALTSACGTHTTGGESSLPPTAEVGSKDEERVAGGVWGACYEGFAPTGNAKSDLGRLTRSCGKTGGMRAITPVKSAAQNERDPADRYTFYVPSAGACYRVYATGDKGVQDLDLLLRGPDGEDVVADISHDSFPVLPPASPMCFETAGLYMLEVSVFKGGGNYAVQVWGNPKGLSRDSGKTSVKSQ